MNDEALNVRPAQDGDDTGSNSAGTRIFKGNLFRVRDGRAWAFTDEPPPPPPPEVRRPARVAQMLALAHRLEAAIERGDYADRAGVARQLGFTRGRITQLLDLTLLAPDIQKHVLELEAIDGREPLTERGLREVVRHAGWADQRAAWGQIRSESPTTA